MEIAKATRKRSLPKSKRIKVCSTSSVKPKTELPSYDDVNVPVENMFACVMCGTMQLKPTIMMLDKPFCGRDCTRDFQHYGVPIHPPFPTLTFKVWDAGKVQVAASAVGPKLDRRRINRRDVLSQSYSWLPALGDSNFFAAPVKCFRHAPAATFWGIIGTGFCLEVENVDSKDHQLSPGTCWFAEILHVSGYFGLVRYAGMEDDASQDLWINLMGPTVHSVSWAVRHGKPTKPPKCLLDHPRSCEEWKEYLARDFLTGKHVPWTFAQMAKSDEESRFCVGMTAELFDKNCLAQVRPAKITKICGKRLTLQYLGDDPEYNEGFVCHQDSNLLHPVGWATRVEADIDADVKYLVKCETGEWDEDDATMDFFNEPRRWILPPDCRIEEGMKLEAIDPLNLSTICVATVKKVLREGYLMFAIDSYSPSKSHTDWFCLHISSTAIFPAGFCEQNDITLTPPRGYNDNHMFVWAEYLAATGYQAAPIWPKNVPHHGFKVGMKVECVDLMEPEKICVATVGRVCGRLLRFHFDGWGDEYDQWMDCQSPDIFPVGWCDLSRHKLEGPRVVGGDPDPETKPVHALKLRAALSKTRGAQKLKNKPTQGDSDTEFVPEAKSTRPIKLRQSYGRKPWTLRKSKSKAAEKDSTSEDLPDDVSNTPLPSLSPVKSEPPPQCSPVEACSPPSGPPLQVSCPGSTEPCTPAPSSSSISPILSQMKLTFSTPPTLSPHRTLSVPRLTSDQKKQALSHTSKNLSFDQVMESISSAPRLSPNLPCALPNKDVQQVSPMEVVSSSDDEAPVLSEAEVDEAVSEEDEDVLEEDEDVSEEDDKVSEEDEEVTEASDDMRRGPRKEDAKERRGTNLYLRPRKATVFKTRPLTRASQRKPLLRSTHLLAARASKRVTKAREEQNTRLTGSPGRASRQQNLRPKPLMTPAQAQPHVNPSVSDSAAMKPTVKTATKPTVRSAEIPTVKTATKPTVRSAEIPTVKTATKLTVRSAAKSAVKSANPDVKRSAKSAVKTDKKTTGKSATKPAVKSDVNPDVRRAAKSAMKTAQSPTSKSATKPAIRSATKPAVKTASSPAKKSATKPAVRSATKAVKSPATPDVKSASKPAVKLEVDRSPKIERQKLSSLPLPLPIQEVDDPTDLPWVLPGNPSTSQSTARMATSGRVIPRLNGSPKAAYNAEDIDPTEWSVKDVVCFLKVNNLSQCCESFSQLKIDGATFLNMTHSTIILLTANKIAPALAISELVQKLKSIARTRASKTLV